MPKYELGYILSSGVSDDQVPKITSDIAEDVKSSGGIILNEDHWGRKKLAYPIDRTRNGYYVFITVELDVTKVAEIEHRLRTRDTVIRFIIINTAEADRRRLRDAELQKKHQSSRKPKEEVKPEEGASLDQEIEKAIKGE